MSTPFSDQSRHDPLLGNRLALRQDSSDVDRQHLLAVDVKRNLFVLEIRDHHLGPER